MLNAHVSSKHGVEWSHAHTHIERGDIIYNGLRMGYWDGDERGWRMRMGGLDGKGKKVLRRIG